MVFTLIRLIKDLPLNSNIQTTGVYELPTLTKVMKDCTSAKYQHILHEHFEHNFMSKVSSRNPSFFLFCCCYGLCDRFFFFHFQAKSYVVETQKHEKLWIMLMGGGEEKSQFKVKAPFNVFSKWNVQMYKNARTISGWYVYLSAHPSSLRIFWLQTINTHTHMKHLTMKTDIMASIVNMFSFLLFSSRCINELKHKHFH